MRLTERLKALEAMISIPDSSTDLLNKLCHGLGVPGTRILGRMHGQRTLAGRLAAIADCDIILLLSALGQHRQADRLDPWAVLTPDTLRDRVMSGDETELFKAIMEVSDARDDYCRGALRRRP